MPKRNTPPDVNTAFAMHFERHAQDAGRQSIVAAAETETNPIELLRFAEARFHGLVNGFATSFFDSWRSIGPPFRVASQRAMTALALVAGKLWKEPEGPSKNGKTFATAVMREGGGDVVTWWSVIAFADNASELLRLEDSDALSVSGPFTVEAYVKESRDHAA